MDSTYNIKNILGRRIINLFASVTNISPIIKRGFATTESIKRNSILFIGLNPSFIKKFEPSKPEHIFHELKQKGNYKYFKRFEEISEYCNHPWEHLDLLFLRETKQKSVSNLTKTPEGLNFIWQNLIISKEILENVTPKIIVVTNTVARTFLGKDISSKSQNKWLGYTFEFDHSIGTHKISTKESRLTGTPVFFSSMLTGQRALDNGSFERLKWHIHWILKNNAS